MPIVALTSMPWVYAEQAPGYLFFPAVSLLKCGTNPGSNLIKDKVMSSYAMLV